LFSVEGRAVCQIVLFAIAILLGLGGCLAARRLRKRLDDVVGKTICCGTCARWNEMTTREEAVQNRNGSSPSQPAEWGICGKNGRPRRRSSYCGDWEPRGCRRTPS